MKGNKIPAKLLLAGEFTVLTGGEAIGIPFPKFNGQWAFGNTVDHQLENLIQYLISNKNDFLDLDLFQLDINHGLIFQSSIPEGYGLGGSGALSAAVLQRYSSNLGPDVKTIQQQLANIESCFHGTSSGFDPLISYFNQGCLIQNKEIHLLADTASIHSKIDSGLYLIDSNMERKNITPILWFYEQLQSDIFKNKIATLNGLNTQFIRSLLDPHRYAASPVIQEISSLQYELFQPLIVPSMKHLWESGLKQGSHFCKLCGKGGGGYYYVWVNATYLPSLQLEYPELRFITINQSDRFTHNQ